MAIQALWTGGAESLQMTFLGQAAVLGQFQHPNILRLEGVVTKSRPLMVLTELMELGPLDSFLRVSRAWRLRGAGGLCRESGPFSAVPETELSAFGPSCPTSRGLHPSFPGCSDPRSTPPPPPPRHLAPVCALLCRGPPTFADLCPLSLSSGRASSAACNWWPCSVEWPPPCSTCLALPSSTARSLPTACW